MATSWQHHALNTSFPGGHTMFAWSMATVLAREYPKTWVRILAYGAAGTVTVSRFMAHDHWSSDMLMGTALGFAIGTHIFHSHCEPLAHERRSSNGRTSPLVCPHLSPIQQLSEL